VCVCLCVSKCESIPSLRFVPSNKIQIFSASCLSLLPCLRQIISEVTEIKAMNASLLINFRYGICKEAALKSKVKKSLRTKYIYA